MINNSFMNKETGKIEDNPEFLEFLNKEFNQTAVSATVEELAEFAFGSIDEAVKAFEKSKKD